MSPNEYKEVIFEAFDTSAKQFVRLLLLILIPFSAVAYQHLG